MSCGRPWTSAGAAADLGDTLLPPVDSQEVWAAGVTYERSRAGRVEESTEAGVYDRVYLARRPEVFFKATAQRVVGDEEPIGVRADSPWNAPEPELGLVLNANGEIFGYVVGNDVSSRTIEGENPLYLSQAKVYDRSCSLGPGIVPIWAAPELPFDIALRVQRGDAVAYEESTSTASITRPFEDLAAWFDGRAHLPGRRDPAHRYGHRAGPVVHTARWRCRHRRHSRYRHAHQPSGPRRPAISTGRNHDSAGLAGPRSGRHPIEGARSTDRRGGRRCSGTCRLRALRSGQLAGPRGVPAGRRDR